MEFFEKAVGVSLKSHRDKYLVAGEDQVTVRQSSSAASTHRARWLIEHVESNKHVIRLKSCYGRYLTASNTPFFLGTSGNKILQSLPENSMDLAIEWQPVREGFQFKLKSSAGTYLRANGAMPPWRNTVTHDGSVTRSNNNSILWDVEAVDIPEDEEVNDYLSLVSSFSPSVSGELSGVETGSPVSVRSPSFSPRTPTLLSMNKKHPIEESRAAVIDFLRNANAVRLKSHHNRFLHADHDQTSVSQHRSDTAWNNRWTLEFVTNTPDNITIVRLKSCYNKYLTASDHPFLLGTTGKKVVQSVPLRLDSSVEWEPIREKNQVKLKTRYGHYLRANGGLPPWRNSVTHDIPYRAATKDWILWHVDVVDVTIPSPMTRPRLQLVPYSDSFTSSESSSPSSNTSKSPTFFSQELIVSPPKRKEGRAIYYHIISEDYGESDKNSQGFCISFKGNEVDELTQKLEEETGLQNIMVCTRSPLDGKLYPIQLQLPPNNDIMTVVVVQNSYKPEKQFLLEY